MAEQRGGPGLLDSLAAELRWIHSFDYAARLPIYASIGVLSPRAECGPLYLT